MTRINCHSAFRHYEMFHSGGCGGGNYGSIFNTTYNINCGGHGGFWSGVGYGLGNMLGGMFGGMFNGGGMFGNMFGGGGMFGNMFGGFPSFGGGWGNIWGGGGGGGYTPKTSSTCSCGCKDKDKKTIDKGSIDKSSTSECKDPDRQKLIDFGKKVNAAQGNKNLTAKELKTLYDEIKAAQTASKDEAHHKKTDPSDYQNWLDNLKLLAKAKGWGDPESADFGKTANNDDAAQDVGKKPADANDANVTNAGKKPAAAANADDAGKVTDTNNLTPEQILALTKDQIDKLTDAQAKDLLKKLGIEEDSPVKSDMLINRTALRLLAKAGIRVKVANNTNSLCTDNYIWGTISEVSDDEEQPISYKVNCNNDKSKQKNTYKFVQKAKGEKAFKVTVDQIASGVRLTNSSVTEVVYSDTGDGYLKRDGRPFTTTRA